MVLILSEKDVRQVLTMEDTIAAMESCLVEQSNKRALSPVRTTVDLGFGRSRYNPDQAGFMRMLPGSIPDAGYLGLKIYVDVSPDFSDRTVLFLYNTRGEFLSMISADFLSDVRTGAIGGVAAKYLARKDASRVGLFGSGRQARTQLLAVASVRQIRSVMVNSRNPEHAARFVNDMRSQVDADIEVCNDPSELVRDSDIIVTATTSSEPLFPGNHVAEGTHVNAIGASFPAAREVDGALVGRSKIVVNFKEQALRENGELIIPVSRKELPSIEIYAELCDIVAGKVPGRTNDREITLFKFNGLAIWDIAAGAIAYQRAREKGLGHEADL